MTQKTIVPPADVAELVRLLETHDRMLLITNPTLAERKQWRSVLWFDLNHGGLPSGTRLRYSGRDGGDLTVRLVADTDENTPTVKPAAPAVAVPATVPRRLHPAVAATKLIAKPDWDGWVSTRHRSDVVHLFMSPAALPRMWRVLHVLFVEAERRGYQVGVGKDRHGTDCGIGIVIDDVAVEVAASEKQKKVPHVWTPTEHRDHERYGRTPNKINDWIPTGRLRVTVGHDQLRILASDGTRWQIEERVGAMIERLEGVAAERAEQARLREIERIAQAARNEVHRERQRLADIDEHNVKQLLVRVAAHADAERIRAYLHSAASARPELTEAETEWLRWAHQHADTVDSVQEPLAHPPTPRHLETA